MGRTWRNSVQDEYYYELDTSQVIDDAYERAYQAQCQRELALWQKRRKDENSGSQLPPF